MLIRFKKLADCPLGTLCYINKSWRWVGETNEDGVVQTIIEPMLSKPRRGVPFFIDESPNSVVIGIPTLAATKAFISLLNDK